MNSSIEGEVYGRLTFLHKDESKYPKWFCECICGNIKSINKYKVISGNTRSCGCLQRESRIKHGLARSRTESSWHHMLQRCFNKKNDSYERYGGLGVSVCDEWLTLSGFHKDMGDRPEGMTIDRIDSSGDYCKSNCRWSSNSVQNHNRSFGKTKGVWASGNKWFSQIGKENEKFFLGMFSTQALAVEAYNVKAIELYGLSASLSEVVDEASKNTR